MKKYSSNKAQKGKTAYRTPGKFKIQKSQFSKAKLCQRMPRTTSK